MPLGAFLAKINIFILTSLVNFNKATEKKIHRPRAEEAISKRKLSYDTPLY